MNTYSDTEKMLAEGRIMGMQLGLGLLSNKNLWQIFTAMDAVRTPPHPTEVGEAVASFQASVSVWMEQCFLPSLYSNMTERGDRLLEEVLELLQAKGYDPIRVTTLVSYVWGRPVGNPVQEVGGVMVTLAGYCWVAGLDMHAAGNAELARINRPEVMVRIRTKQEAKNALHFDTPLPANSAEGKLVPDGFELDGGKNGSIAIRCKDGRKAVLRCDRGLSYNDRLVMDFLQAMLNAAVSTSKEDA